MQKKEILIGAHFSGAKGLDLALSKANQAGANIAQIFTANQRQWSSKPLEENLIKSFKEAKERFSIKQVMSHSSYLINLGSPDETNLTKSKKNFMEELERCRLLEIDYLTFHPGSRIDKEENECLDRISESLIDLAPHINKGRTMVLLETTAGQGSNVGYKFEHLGYIIKKVKPHIPIGICVDTCHIFVAGYDIRTENGWNKVLEEFNEKIGLEYLKAFHMNDSKNELGSKKDRHEQIGHGKIGIDCFKFLMEDVRVNYLPKYLETPDPEKFKGEIALLKKIAG